MITKEQAMQIAQHERPGSPLSGVVMANDEVYVVGFEGDDPFGALVVSVDKRSGAAETLGADEYTDIRKTLQPV